MDIKQQYETLKLDYINIQQDIEKVESTGQSAEALQNKLVEIEKQLSLLRDQLDE